VYAAQFFGFAMSIDVTCMAFMSMALKMVEFLDLSKKYLTLRYILPANYRFRSGKWWSMHFFFSSAVAATQTAVLII